MPTIIITITINITLTTTIIIIIIMMMMGMVMVMAMVMVGTCCFLLVLHPMNCRHTHNCNYITFHTPQA